MSVASILPSADWAAIPDSFLRVLNDRFRELSGGTTATAAGSIAGLFFTHAHRPDANGTTVGTFGTETDRTVVYQVETVSSAQVWRYVSGTMTAVLASRPTDLGANDAGFRFCASDEYDYLWSGSAWGAPGGGRQIQSARPAFKATATAGTQPGRIGPQAGDGSVYVSLNVSFDGTNFNLDDTSKTGTLLRLTGGALALFNFPAHANPVTGVIVQTLDVSVAGDVDAKTGVYKKGGTAGESTTLTYLTGTPGAGQSSKTVTFSGGIETSHT